MRDVKSKNDLLKNSLDLQNLQKLAKLADYNHTINNDSKTKDELIKELIENRTDFIDNYLNYIEKLRQCGNNKILTEIYKISPVLGNELEAYEHITKPIIVLKLIEYKLTNSIDRITLLTKVTRPISYSPIAIIGNFRTDLGDINKIIEELNNSIKEYNNKNFNKVELSDYIYLSNDNKCIIEYRIEVGKRTYQQLFLRRKKRRVSVYPTKVRLIQFDCNKNEYLTNLSQDHPLVNLSLQVLIIDKDCSGSNVRFIQPEDEAQLESILKDRISKKIVYLEKLKTPQSEREISVLKEITDFNRTKILLKNIPVDGNPHTFLIDADDADKAMLAIGISKSIKRDIIKKCESYEFAISYKGAKINVSPTCLTINRGKSKISDSELNVIIDLLRD